MLLWYSRSLKTLRLRSSLPPLPLWQSDSGTLSKRLCHLPHRLLPEPIAKRSYIINSLSHWQSWSSAFLPRSCRPLFPTTGFPFCGWFFFPSPGLPLSSPGALLKPLLPFIQTLNLGRTNHPRTIPITQPGRTRSKHPSIFITPFPLSSRRRGPTRPGPLPRSRGCSPGAPAADGSAPWPGSPALPPLCEGALAPRLAPW